MSSDEYGAVVEVSTTNLGAVFTADTAISATSLPLDDVSVFEELGGQVYIDGNIYYYTAVTLTGTGGAAPSAPVEVVTAESVWNTTTTPKTATISGCVTGDWLAVIAGGDQGPSNGVSAATSTTTAGTTSAWSELAEDLDTDGSACWYHSAAAQVTADGSVTVQVDRTKVGAVGGNWGFLVVRGRSCAGVSLLGQQGTSGSGQTITGAPSTGSAVATGFFDWNGTSVPTAWTPTGQTVIESSQLSDYTIAAAYWTGQASGFRSYGTTNFSSSKLKGVALELLAAPAGAAPASPPAGVMTLLTGLLTAAVADQTGVEIYPPAPSRTAMVALGIEEGEAVRVTIPHYFSGMPDGVRPVDAREIALIEERNPGELYLKDIMSKGMTLLGPGEDLDDYVSTGNFIQLFSVDAAGGTNYPVPYAGVLEVLATQPARLMMQRYTAYRNAARIAPSAWVRTFGADVWTPWQSLSNEVNPVLADLTASSTLTITTTATLIPGLTATFTPVSAGAVYLVLGVFDCTGTAGATNTPVAELFVDSTAQSEQAIHFAPGVHATVAQNWIVSGLSVASHTLQLRARGTTGVSGYTAGVQSTLKIIQMSS